MTTPLLELVEISKAFGPKKANDRVNISVAPGEVHAVVGENGAGKTTLMTMIAGTAQPDSGMIYVSGSEVTIGSPAIASGLGIGMVHQHFKLVPSLSVAANVFLGREVKSRRGTLDSAAMEHRVSELSQRFGLEIDPQAKVENLSIGQKQRVEVLKALSHDTQLLILDEPTAVLTPRETEELFAVVRRLADEGKSILFISHKLGEVLAVADTVSVIRDGCSVGTVPAQGLSQSDVARMMVGRDVLLRIDNHGANPGQDILQVEDLVVADRRGSLVVKNLSLSVRAGEILGVAGVEGNGQSELAAAIAGLEEVLKGSIRVKGQDITHASVAARRDGGLAYIPEDRHEVGTAPSLSVQDNLIATHLTAPIVGGGLIKERQAKEFSDSLISQYDIRGASAHTEVSTLSGGNMQKVVIAREFASDPTLLVVSQPTRGVDVGAMEFVHNAIISQRDAGAAVLLFSADLNEVLSLSDRLVVMYRGQIIAEFDRAEFDEVAVGLAMAGVAPEVSAPALAPQKSLDPKEPEHRAASPEKTAAVVADPRLVTSERSMLRSLWSGLNRPLAAVLISLLVGAVVIVLLGRHPLQAYDQLFFSNFRSPHGWAGFIAQFIPLSILAAGVIVTFRAGIFNIGGEGQLFMGAFWGAFAGYTFVDLPAPILIVLIVLFGALGGGLWGAIPGWLYARWKTDIIVTTLMMSSIAALVTAYLVTGPLKDPDAGMAASRKIAQGARLPMFSPSYGIGMDLVLAMIVVVVVALIITRSVWGLRLRETGQMNDFAIYTGVKDKRMTIQVMALGGVISGLAGALFVLGPNGGRFLQGFSPGYGFLGITVALLARLNPWAAIVAAAFYANMMAGANAMQMNAEVPFPLVNVLQGLIILTITVSVVVDKKLGKRLRALLPPRRQSSSIEERN